MILCDLCSCIKDIPTNAKIMICSSWGWYASDAYSVFYDKKENVLYIVNETTSESNFLVYLPNGDDLDLHDLIRMI